MVDLEVVVVAATVVTGAIEGGAVGDLLDDGDDLSLDQHVLGFQHRADEELVVTGAAEHVELGRHVVGDELVIAAAAENGDLLDSCIVDDLKVLAGGQRRLADLHQGVFVVGIGLAVAAECWVAVADDQAVAMHAVAEPAAVREGLVFVLEGVVDGVELDGVVVFAALVDQRVDAASSGVTDVEVLLAQD